MKDKFLKLALVTVGVLLVLNLVFSTTAANNGKKYEPIEYKVVDTKPIHRHPEELVASLNELGQEGWEVVYIYPVADLVLLKR